MTNDEDISALLRHSAAGWLEAHGDLARLRGSLGVPRPIDREHWREMAEMGWLGLMLPEPLGGSGLGLAEACDLAGLFGRKLLIEPFVASALIPATIIAACAGVPQTTLADELVSGERVITLVAHGQIALVGETVNGAAELVPAVESAGVLLVRATGQDGRGVLVAVDGDAAGIHVQRAAAGAGASLCRVVFRHTPIRFGAPLLAGEAAVAEALDAGRVALGAQLAGIAAEVLEKTLAYVGQRRQFDRSIGSFQTVQHRCVDLHIGIMLAEASVGHAARLPAGDRAMAAAAAKARAGDVALQTCRAAIQLHGAMGFTDEADIGLYMRDALHLASWLGTPTTLRRRFLSEWKNRETRHA